MQFGLYSFAENTFDPLSDRLQSPVERINDLIEEIRLADELGLDFYGLGEHHRSDFTASAPVTILAGAATATKNIRLSTAVTVLSSLVLILRLVFSAPVAWVAGTATLALLLVLWVALPIASRDDHPRA